jgi:hypothetical protein
VTGDYLWDRTGFPDPELVRLERVLSTLQYQPAVRSWSGAGVMATPPSRTRASFLVLASTAAAVLALVVVSWQQARVPRPALGVTTLAGTPTIASRPIGNSAQLGVGRYLETDAAARAMVDVANVGRVEVSPDTRLGLLTTRPGNHRLDLARGTVEAFIWAPPGQFSMKTPSSTAVDLGCLYTMTVDDDGTGLVRVKMGWVGFEWRGRESFIPEGAACVTRPRLGPGTPHFEDTSAAFRDALETIDLRAGTLMVREAAVNLVLAEARPRDVLTLWHLLSRVDASQRDRVFDRLAGFVAPPPEVTREGIASGDREMLDAWWNKLELGSASWWRIWKQQWRDNASGR